MGIQAILDSQLFTLVSVLGGMAFAYVVLPSIVLPRPRSARTGLDAVVVRSVRWLAVVLVVSHLLLLVRLFHVNPIVLLCLFGWHRKRRAAGKEMAWSTPDGSLPQRLWIAFTDLFHLFERSGTAVFRDAATTVRRRVAGAVATVTDRRRLQAFALVSPVLGVLLASLWLRVEQAFRHETLSPPDAYVFLTWAKAFGNNEPFLDGLYPQGLPNIVAFLGKTWPGMDPYSVIRYTGPLTGMLLVFGLFYACLRLTANVGAALFTSGAFGLFGASYLWHAPWSRQTGPLPEELGLAIALLALPSAVLAVTERDDDHLRTVALAAVAIGFIHPVPLVLYLLFAATAAVAAAVASGRGLRQPGRVLGAGAAGAVASHLYLPIGILLGVPVFRGLDNPFGSTPLGQSEDEFLFGALGTSNIGHNSLSLLAAAGAVLALFAAWWLCRQARTRRVGAQLAGLAAVGLVAVALYDVRWIPAPLNILGPAANLAGITLALALGVGIAALTAVAFAVPDPLRRAGAVVTVAAVALVSFGVTFDAGSRERNPSEYEATAEVTREIMLGQDAFSYTIVGTPQQRHAVAGVGTFIELWVFARDVTVRDARDPGFVVPDLTSLLFARSLGESLPIPTADIYIFVEKVPFPVVEQAPTGPTEEYYYDREKRGRIMAAVYGWAEYYRHYHTDMDVHFEDDQIIVYRIRRRPNAVAAAASPQFKDYGWEPGVLFTGGPSRPSEVEIPWAA